MDGVRSGTFRARVLLFGCDSQNVSKLKNLLDQWPKVAPAMFQLTKHGGDMQSRKGWPVLFHEQFRLWHIHGGEKVHVPTTWLT